MLMFPKYSRCFIIVETLQISMSVRPDFRFCTGCINEGIIGRYFTIVMKTEYFSKMVA